MGEVAEHLAGRPVEVRLRQPFISEANGLTLREGQKAVIDVDPTNPEAELLRVFCHEAAHAKLHFPSIPESSISEAPGSHNFTEYGFKAAVNDPREPQADKQAAEWLRYADQQAGLYERRGHGWLESRLLALKVWPVDVQGIIDNAVKQAVKNFKKELANG